MNTQTIIGEAKQVWGVISTNSRVKSFLWRSGMMFLAGGIDVILSLHTELDLSQGSTVVLGLILGEVTKHINNKVSK